MNDAVSTEGDPFPERITIVPDDYHTPYAGTTGDGRRFFLTDEVFEVTGPGAITGYVATFFWTSDGAFHSVEVEQVLRPTGAPPGQPVHSESSSQIEARLAELGDYTLEPISVAPFAADVDGVTFGFVPRRDDDGTVYVELNPGSIIAYYHPWDGVEYDT